MIAPSPEQYTHVASDDVAAVLAEMISEVADCISRIVASDKYHALVLIGGYGRGEGGVRREGNQEYPNNNLDFLLITRGLTDIAWQRLKQRIEPELDVLQQRYGVGIDLSSIAGSALRRSSCRVMWYDMRHGHKTVLGDASYVPSLSRFQLGRIPDWDVHNLLVNRGTLLIINDLLRSSANVDDLDVICTRHTVKAIIGYGDALLFAHGQYHWSYAEKQRRMRQLDDIDVEFRSMYDAAAEFRFLPRARLPSLLADAERVRQTLESIHLNCESMRLKHPGLQWNSYLNSALAAGLWEDRTAKGIAKATRNVIRQSLRKGVGSCCRQANQWKQLHPSARLGLLSMSTQRLLGSLFPAVAYDSVPDSMREIAAEALGADDPSRRQLQVAFLRCWGEFVDRNFDRFLARFGISVAGPEVAT